MVARIAYYPAYLLLISLHLCSLALKFRHSSLNPQSSALAMLPEKARFVISCGVSVLQSWQARRAVFYDTHWWQCQEAGDAYDDSRYSKNETAR